MMWFLLIFAFSLGMLLSYIIFSQLRNRKLTAEYEQKIAELQRQHQNAIFELQLKQQATISDATKRSVNTSRAVLKGKIAEQLAPILPEFEYLPSDAKFLGDPVDYIIFDGYNAFREGQCSADHIKIVFLDVKSGKARLSAGQQAIANAIQHGRISFKTLRIDF